MTGVSSTPADAGVLETRPIPDQLSSLLVPRSLKQIQNQGVTIRPLRMAIGERNRDAAK